MSVRRWGRKSTEPGRHLTGQGCSTGPWPKHTHKVTSEDVMSKVSHHLHRFICRGSGSNNLFIHIFTEKMSGSLAKGQNPKVPLLGLGSSNLPLTAPPFISPETPKTLPSYLFITLQLNVRLPSPRALCLQPWSFSTSPSPPPGTHI